MVVHQIYPLDPSHAKQHHSSSEHKARIPVVCPEFHLPTAFPLLPEARLRATGKTTVSLSRFGPLFTSNRISGTLGAV
jgi:hypothetical protein